MIRFVCERCWVDYFLDDAWGGKRVKCRECHAIGLVPDADKAAPDAATEADEEASVVPAGVAVMAGEGRGGAGAAEPSTHEADAGAVGGPSGLYGLAPDQPGDQASGDGEAAANPAGEISPLPRKRKTRPKEKRPWFVGTVMRFVCPECSKVIQVSSDAAGKLARCPYCDETVDVPNYAPAWQLTQQAPWTWQEVAVVIALGLLVLLSLIGVLGGMLSR